MMKAMVYEQYGPPEMLRLETVERPTPKADEVLVAVKASAVNFSSSATVRGKPMLVRLMSGLMAPKNPIPGGDIAGVVAAVGSAVRQFHVGDAVYADLSGWRWGGYAEYVSVPEKLLARMPATLSFEQAAGVPEAAVVALQGLRDLGKLQAGEEVLIQGASGGIGTFAVQIAKAMGAVVTAVCSTRNVELVRELGADHVIDYTREDFTQNGKLYDLILATVGYRPILEYRRSLAADGTYVATGGTLRQIFESLLLGPILSRGGKRLANLLVRPNAADLAYVAQLIDSGQMKPVIDRMYPLEETAAAIKYYEEGRSRGKVIIQVQASEGV